MDKYRAEEPRYLWYCGTKKYRKVDGTGTVEKWYGGAAVVPWYRATLTRWHHLLFSPQSREHHKQHKSDVKSTSKCKNLGWKLMRIAVLLLLFVQIVVIWWGNIVDWQKVVYLWKVCWRTKRRMHNVKWGRKKTPNFGQFFALKILWADVDGPKLKQLPIIMRNFLAVGRWVSKNENHISVSK